MTWTHRVAEAGDYQLGMAWVEVKSGEEVVVTVTAGGKEVKSLKAHAGLAPQRLETRIEGLAVGDEITVKAVPKGASYRLGCQVAFGTPTFPGARVFHVKDFGAVGDGKTDDFAAIQRAVAAARESDCGILRFDGSKTYRTIGKSDFTEEPLLDLKGAKHLKIEGQGAMIVLHEESLNRGSVVRNCSTSNIGTEYSSTRFRCVDLSFENNRFEDFHFWFHAGPNGPRPRGIIIKDSYVSDEDLSQFNFQQGLDCLLSGNEFDGVTLDFQKSENMGVVRNRWSGMKDDQMSVKASKGSDLHLGSDNKRAGENFKKWVKTDRTSTAK